MVKHYKVLVKLNFRDHQQNELTPFPLGIKQLAHSFLFLFSNKLLAIRAGVHKMLVRIANREDPNQTASEEAV